MKKTLKLLLLAVMMMMGGSTLAATTVKWLASSGNSLSSSIAVDDYITLTWSDGGNDSWPKYQDGYVHFYSRNRVTVAGAEGVTITKVAFTFKEGGSTQMNTWINNKTDGPNLTNGVWTGEQNSIIFTTMRGSSTARDIAAVEVTYLKAGETAEEQFADMSITGSSLNTAVDLDNGGYFSVNYANVGDAAAENAVLTVYVDGKKNTTKELGTVAVAYTGTAYMYYDASSIEAGEYDVYMTIAADNDAAEGTGTKKTEPVKVTFTKKAPEATFSVTAQDVTVAYDATSYDVVAKVTNTSTINAKDVVVTLYDAGTAVATTTVDVAAGATVDATLTVSGGPFDAGKKQLQVVVGTANKWIWVTVEEAPIVAAIDMELVQFMALSEINLKETNTVTVWYKNNSNVAVETATVTLKLNGAVVETKTIENVALNGSGGVSFTVPTTGLTAGTKATLEATIAATGDNDATNNTISREYDIVSGEPTEATFSVTAEDVTVAYDAKSYNVVAKVENTSSVDATDVTVQLLNGTTVMAETTISSLKAGASTEAVLTVNGPFEAGTTEMQVVVANKASKWIKVTVEEAPVTPVYDLAITEVLGSDIQLSAETNTIRVTVQNNGNQDITDAPVVLKAGDKILGRATVSAKAEAQGWCMVSITTDGLTAGDIEVTATVTVENDATPEDNTKTVTINVKPAAVEEPTFTVTAENVTVAYGAKSFNIVATVKNTSEVEANKVEVKLLQGISEVATETIKSLAAGQETTVTFNLTEMGEAGKTVSYFVQVAGTAQTEVEVTFLPAPIEEKVDLAITNVSGTIYTDVENNYVSVQVQNNGTVDVTDAVVTVTAGTTVLGTNTVSVKAGDAKLISVPVDVKGLQQGEIDIVVKVVADGEAADTQADNEVTKTITVTVATGIDTVKAQTTANGQVYTIGGQKANSQRRGQLYIVNGKKMLKK